MDGVVKGQLVEVIDRDTNNWAYGVVHHVYDDRVHIKVEPYSCIDLRNGMHVISTSEDSDEPSSDKYRIIYLQRDGKPVMCKRSILGQYKFKPRK